MPGKPFRFKQFEVYQDHSAMKVGTDSVLLSVWARVSEARRILDVGTGTGIIALMCAQRNPKATIEAIDIDEGSCEDAANNFANSPWSDRLFLHHQDFLDFKPHGRYDVIISNPPYFSNSIRAHDPSRSAARHDDALPAAALLEKAQKMLDPEGSLSVIFPKNYLEKWESAARQFGFHPRRVCHVFTLPHKDSQRVMVEYRLTESSDTEMESVLIEQYPGVISDQYRMMTEPFFMK